MSELRSLYISFSDGLVGHFGRQLTLEEAAAETTQRCSQTNRAAVIIDREGYRVVGKVNMIGGSRWVYYPVVKGEAP